MIDACHTTSARRLRRTTSVVLSLISPRVVLWSIAFSIWCSMALAQPAPILRVTLSPSQVVVGQPATLHIELLVPNYLTTPPAFPDFQIRNAVTRPLGGLNISEVRDGMTYAGIMRAFAIHPQEPGVYAVTGQAISVTYAADPPRLQQATLALPAVSFEAVIPDAAAGLDPFVATSRLTLRQAVDHPTGDPKVGDAVTRTVTVEGDGIPAMLLPPITFNAPPEMAAYPAPPSLEDRSEQRSDIMVGRRIDRISYVLEKPGDYVLPGIDIAWWNLHDRKIERTHVDPIVLHVLPNPALAPGASDARPARTSSWSRMIATTVLDHWPVLAIAAFLLGGLAWCVPLALGSLRAWHERRQHAWLQSEMFMFARLRHAARHEDAAATYFVLMQWLARFAPVAPAHTIDALRTAARDPRLDRQLLALETRLFGTPANDPGDYAPRLLMRRTAAIRRRLRRHQASGHQAGPLATTLNPVAPAVSSHPRHRPVAR